MSIQYTQAILFYSAIVLLILINRKKFDIQGIVALYRTKIGLRLMDKISHKYNSLVKIMGYIGIGIGYSGLIFISYVLLKNVYELILNPEAKSAVAPAFPGIPISGIYIPLISGWIALFIVILVHEFSHGVVARAHKLKIKSSGLFFLGPIMGAFVEPEEKILQKQKDVTKYSVFGAGPFSNILIAIVAVLFLISIVNPTINYMTESIGFSINDVTKEYPAAESGLTKGMVVTEINNKTVKSYSDFDKEMQCVKPNQTITLEANNTLFAIKTTESPDTKGKGFIGILIGKNEIRVKKDSLFTNTMYKFLSWLNELFVLVFILSLGIGLINLYPIFITDGARMLLVSVEDIVHNKKKARRIWTQINFFALIILAFGLLQPLFRWLFTLTLF